MNPETGAKTDTVYIPWGTLQEELQLSTYGNKAYWGFTGANGSNSGKVKFVFTQVPVDQSTKVENDVLVNGQSIVDTTNSSQYQQGIPAAQPGDKVTITTNLTVQGNSETGYQIKNWQSFLSPSLYDYSKGLTDFKVSLDGSEVATSGATSKFDPATGNVSFDFSSKPIQIPKPTNNTAKVLTVSYVAQLRSDITTSQKTYHSSQFSGTEINGPAISINGYHVIQPCYRGMVLPPVIKRKKST